MAGEKLDRFGIACRVAREFQDGMIVNLGVGIPTLCSSFIPPGREILLHSENGVLGYGEIVRDPAQLDPFLTNAGGQPVAMRPGMALVDHAESFAMIRGGRIDITVLGAHTVSENGDLANNTTPGKQVGSLGGGQDLAFCARKVIVAMPHIDKNGQPKLVKRCTGPLTAPACVKLVVTDIAVIEISPEGLLLSEMMPGWTPEEVQEVTEPRLRISPHLREMKLA